MSTITLPNIRVSSDLTIRLKLKDGGVAIDWSTLQNIRVSLYADDQRSMASRCSVSIDEEDSTILVCQYAANKMQYLGVNRVIVQCKYLGEVKTYDKPAFTFVRWTSDQEGEQITIDDPDVDVEISVEDVSSSILQEAVDAAFSAADRANEAAEEAEHMVDIHTGPEGKSAYEVAVEEGYTGTEEEWLASLKGPVGETPDISIGTVTTVEPGTPAAASMTGTPEAPVLNLSIPKGLVGATPNFTVGTVTTGEPGSSVVVTITGTPEAPVLNLTIPQGMQGNTGSSVDYPYELVNNLTTNDATKGLSAAQGVVLDGKVSQLEHKLIKLTGMGASSSVAGATHIGDTYYNTTAKNLRRIKSSGGTYDIIPFYDGAIYTIGEDFYVWNGSDLVYAQLQQYLIRETDSVVNDIIKFDVGSVSLSTGEDSAVANRARSNYINGIFTFVVASGWIIKYWYKYRRAANGIFTFIEGAGHNNTQFVSTDNNYWYRLVVGKSNDSNVANSELDSVASSFKGKLSSFISSVETQTNDIVNDIDAFNDAFSAFHKEKLPRYRWESGTIANTGREDGSTKKIRTATYFHSDGNLVFVYLKPGFAFRYFSYNGNKEFVAYEGEKTSSFEFTPINGYYYRFSLWRVDNEDFSPDDFSGEDFSVSGFPLDENDYINGYKRPLYDSEINLSGKVVAFLGDSITQQSAATSQLNTYHGVFSQKTGCIPRNLGINGTCIANNTKNELGASRFVTRATSENLSDASMVVVFGGTNDFAYDSKPIGNLFNETSITPYVNIGDKQLTAPTDQDTFAGALHNLIQTIQANVRPETPIVFMTPLHRDNNYAPNPNYTQCNANGDYMVDFVEAIKKICSFYAIPVLDMYSNSQLNPMSPNWSNLLSDGLHPNNEGHRIIGELLYRFVKQNIVF